jgi:hypothetical protein
MRSTITEALREMRGLNTTDAGRLRGIHLRYSSLSLPHQALSGTPQPWRDQLDNAIAARGAGTVTADSPEYVVLSDNAVVAVLTVAGRVSLPDYPLSSNQAKHQDAAAIPGRPVPTRHPEPRRPAGRPRRSRAGRRRRVRKPPRRGAAGSAVG